MTEAEAIKESAKAVQEIAKTTGKAVEAGQQFGGFIARFISGPLEQRMGIIEDNFKHKRWENQVKLQLKAEGFLREQGLIEPTKPLSLKVAIPFFQAAMLEEDDSLQDLWAALLVNGTNAESGIEMQRSFVNVLENISSFDAKILHALYTSPHPDVEREGFWTAGLPDELIPVPPKNTENRKDELPAALKFSLVNLERMDCLKLGEAFYGGQLFDRVHRTVFGQFFYDACTIKKKS